MGRPRKNSPTPPPADTPDTKEQTSIAEAPIDTKEPFSDDPLSHTQTFATSAPPYVSVDAPPTVTIKAPERERVDRNERIKSYQDGSVCPFIRSICIKQKCALWIGTIESEDEDEKVEINRCGFVFSGQNQLNTNQLLALIIARGEEDEDEDEDDDSDTDTETETDEEKVSAVYKEISKKSNQIVDLDF